MYFAAETVGPISIPWGSLKEYFPITSSINQHFWKDNTRLVSIDIMVENCRLNYIKRKY
jgi:hypothetical protein